MAAVASRKIIGYVQEQASSDAFEMKRFRREVLAGRCFYDNNQEELDLQCSGGFPGRG